MAEISDELVDQLASLAASLSAFVAAIHSPTDRLSDDIQKQVNERIARGVCLQCQAELAKEKRVTRGLCATCYARSVQRVRRQQVTWGWLISNGFILAESAKGGRKSARPDPVGDMIVQRQPPEPLDEAMEKQGEELVRRAERRPRSKRK